jgi:hypothetical protein
MISPWPALPLSGRQVVVPDVRQVKPRAAAWRPLNGNPSDRVWLRAGRRHHSLVYGRTLPHSSLACAQTVPGAGYGEIMNRL